MLKNYLKITWRNLKKNKVFSFINIIGLTIGVTCCMLIVLYVSNEVSVDRFHPDAARIFRLMRSFESNSGKRDVAYVSGPYAKGLKTDYKGQIEDVVRVMPVNGLLQLGNTVYNEKKIYLADSSFFTMFGFGLVKGDPATVLKDPLSIVLTESVAKKYFGDSDPMGKMLEVDKTLQVKVTGIAKDVPSNSTLDFDMIIPIKHWDQFGWMQGWTNNNLFTYLKLYKPADAAILDKDFPRFRDKYMGTEIAELKMKFDLFLRPLKDVYFEKVTASDSMRHGDQKMVYIFLCIAILVLVIACINFTNLSTLRAVERSKEVGLRKVMGALRNNLIRQFIGEAIALTLISCILSVGLFLLVKPLYTQLVGYPLDVNWASWQIYAFFLAITLVVGLLAGSYPALVLSSFSPIQALKGKLKIGKSGSFFRQALVVVQFGISVVLIIGMIVVVVQMRYVKNRELGYDQSQSLIIPLDNDGIYNHHLAFKRDLQNRSDIESVTVASGEPGGFHDSHNFEAEGEHEDILKMRTAFVDFEYLKTLGIKPIAGRDFSPAFRTDSTDAVVINRAAASLMGYTPDQAVGKWILNKFRDSTRRRVIGVVEDYNYLSLKNTIEPLVISTSNDKRLIIVKIKPGNITASLDAIRKEYAKAAPLYPFEYTFLDEKFDLLYKKDIQQQSILTVFAGLAIFIACLGLFGLASFTAAKRTKEIGVRKVIGSSTWNIVMLLSKDLLKPVLIATIIAIPVGYTLMDSWLQNYAYRISISWWIFLVAALIATMIAVVTVSFQAVKAAMMNPVKSLRSE